MSKTEGKPAKGVAGAGVNSDSASKPITYRDAGVDIDAGNALVRLISPLVKATARPGADGSVGGFGGVFDLKSAGFRDPLLVACNDGVGTKVKIAIETGRHDTIGIDLVAMCVNDLVVQGAEPLFFLDYFATGVLDTACARSVIAGVAAGCREAGCALIGGETAEMPGLYAAGDYDLAGFAVGAVERDRLLPRGDMRPGDKLIGLASSGVHSNGYSLVRKLVGNAGLSWDEPAPWAPSRTVGDALLEPTRIYVTSLLAAIGATSSTGDDGIRAMAHITGGGLSENLPRVLPDGLAAEIDLSSFVPPAVFCWLRNAGRLRDEEMLRTFNCGVGMVLVVKADNEASVVGALNAAGETTFEMGQLVAAADEHGNDATGHVAYKGVLDWRP